MLHLATILKLVGTKLGATAAAATLAVGSVAVVQTSDLDPMDGTELIVQETPEEESAAGSEDDTTDDGADGADDGAADDGSVGDEVTEEETQAVVGVDAEVCEDDGSTDGDVDGSDDGSTDGSDDGTTDGSDDGTTDGSDDGTTDDGATACDDGSEGERGSATSERVHAALTLDGELRPGDEGWGAAVSESARSGGHGKRVSAAARGIELEDDEDIALEPTVDDDEPAEVTTQSEARGNGGKGKGNSGSAPGNGRGKRG